MEYFEQELEKGQVGDFDSVTSDYYNDKPVLEKQSNNSSLEESRLNDILTKVNTLPTDKHFHPSILEIYQKRLSDFKKNKIDWFMAE